MSRGVLLDRKAGPGGSAHSAPEGTGFARGRWTLTLPTTLAVTPCFSKARQRERPLSGPSLERMMGLEPTTFCMASRRSSQLSYIREAADYSRLFARRSGARTTRRWAGSEPASRTGPRRAPHERLGAIGYRTSGERSGRWGCRGTEEGSASGAGPSRLKDYARSSASFTSRSASSLCSRRTAR
jgi:hypothetical protein